MVLTTLSRTVARAGVLGRVATKAPTTNSAIVAPRFSGNVRCFADYDWNMGVPGSRIRNPDPQGYNDVAPPMGFKWWALMLTSGACFVWGNTYDLSRGVNIAIGLFGPNAPM
eukprot:TRINITY_DN50902_c0_g1_i1.p2 TRINITY_DN50902_c0_g1~~TRINITY_DN50902_c0_g1_i1.p2  ORF type:complete len:112 (-),score=11.04 TRINITY_DN50902_c0_g1_i1:98-433(-)